MPATRLIFFRAANGDVLLRSFMRGLQEEHLDHVWIAIKRLAAEGRALRRPHVDYLRNGIWEARVVSGRVHIRILFAYVGQDLVMLTHGITKEGAVPPEEIDRAIRLLEVWKDDPGAHSA